MNIRALMVLCGLVLAGCGPSNEEVNTPADPLQLTRAIAEQLILASENLHDIEMSNYEQRHTLYRCLIEKGFFVKTKNGGWSVAEKGEQIGLKATRSAAIGIEVGYEISKPNTEGASVQVTGIKPAPLSSGGDMAEYKLAIFSRVYADQTTNEAFSCFADLGESSAIMVLYDDGWRVDKVITIAS